MNLNIKSKHINSIAILLIALIALTMVSACNTTASDFSIEIDHISEVMSEVPRQDVICFDTRSFSEFGEDGFAFYDDWYNYYYDKA